jgi:hypothetical protein
VVAVPKALQRRRDACVSAQHEQQTGLSVDCPVSQDKRRSQQQQQQQLQYLNMPFSRDNAEIFFRFDFRVGSVFPRFFPPIFCAK